MPSNISLENYVNFKFPTIYQSQIHISKYSRWNDELSRRETWPETVLRYINWLVDQAGKHNLIFSDDEQKELYEAILNLEVMPSMRCMMTAGRALERDQVAGYNCSYLQISRVKAFSEILYILSCGTGVGFSVERQFINQLPNLPRKLYSTDTTIVVADSRIGWASSLHQLITMLYSGLIPKWDVSKVRIAGAKLKTFGGRASGSGVLVELFKFIIKTFEQAIANHQSKLDSIEVHSIICKIGDVIVSGGVRRSALLSLSNLSDDRMRNAKSGQWWLVNPHFQLANNSWCATEKPDIEVFMDEWISLVKSKSGERGIFSRIAAIKKAASNGRRIVRLDKRAVSPETLSGRIDISEFHNYGTNPCQPDFAPMLTPKGVRTLGQINEGDLIWSEDEWVTIEKKWSTGIKKVYRYRTTAGVFYGTDQHHIVENGLKIPVCEADAIDRLCGPELSVVHDPHIVMDGVVIGDGSRHPPSKEKVYLTIGKDDTDYHHSEVGSLIIRPHAVKYENAWVIETSVEEHELPNLPERQIPERYAQADFSTMASFLRGLYSANGSIVGGRVTLKTTSSTLVEQVQIMLSALGIPSFFTTNKSKPVAWDNGTYIGRESYDINITGGYAERFAQCIGFIQNYKNDKLRIAISKRRNKKNTFSIISIEDIGDLEVFDIRVSGDHHTYWTGACNVSNCSEILLRDMGLCNLSEVVIYPDDTFETLKRKIKIATIFGTIQATLTGSRSFEFLDEQWKINAEEERLLGVSLTGVFCHPILSGRSDVKDTKVLDNFLVGSGVDQKSHGYIKAILCEILPKLRDAAVSTNHYYAKKLGINPSAAITCVKPSGTVSQLVGKDGTAVTSGLHPARGPYFIRTNRANKIDPVAQHMKDSGFPCEEDRRNPNQWVFSFPMKSAEYAVSRTTLSAIEHLEIWLIYARYYCEHKPSVTIEVRDHEWLEVGAFVYKHFDEMSGISFLPFDNHSYEQAPYQDCSKEEYEDLLAKMPRSVDWLNLINYERDDEAVTSQKELACAAGYCDISSFGKAS